MCFEKGEEREGNMTAMKKDDCKIIKIKKLLAEDYGENHGLLVDDIKRVIYNLPKRKVIEWSSEFKDGEKLKEVT